ncbi:MAG TPA: hypothetical protein VIU61_17690 [Kofleriaceae bacterium]
MTKLHLASLLLGSLTITACTDDDESRRDDFVGVWGYESGQFEINCGGQIMQFPLDASLTETFTLGEGTSLAKSDSAGCAGITFELSGDTAELAPVPQSCTIPNQGTSTATSYTITLSADGETLTTASLGTFQAPGAPTTCAFTGSGTLVRL